MVLKNAYTVIILLLLVFYVPIKSEPSADEQKKAVWVEIDTTMVFSNMVSPADAKNRTIAFARECAIKKAMPEEVAITSLLTDYLGETGKHAEEQTAWSIFALSSVGGYIVDEKIQFANMTSFSGEVYTFRVKLRAKIEPTKGERNPAISLDLQLENNYLKDGDELNITARSSVDGYLYLFDFLADNSVLLLFPNHISKNNFIKANTILQIPTKEEKQYGVRYRVKSNPESKVTVETIYGVFCVNPIAGIDKFQQLKKHHVTFSAGDESFTQFQRWLANVPLSQRVEKAVQIHIAKK